MSPLEYLQNIKEEFRCSACYKEGKMDAHHINSIGMGRNRKNQLREHYSAIPLCRICHQEYHKIGKKTFEFKHDINLYETAFSLLSGYLFTMHNSKEKI